MADKILLLDDDPLILRSLHKMLTRQGYEVAMAQNAAEAVKLVAESCFDLVIADVRMAQVDGLEALGMLRQSQPGLRGIVITGYSSEDAPVRAIKCGVDDYLFKPFASADLLSAVRHSLQLQQLERQNARERAQLRRRYVNLIAALVETFESADPYFAGHARRVADVACDIGGAMDFASERVERLEMACLLHDVGLAAVGQEVLRCAGALMEHQEQSLRNRPAAVRELLGRVEDLRDIAGILEAMHERFDGSGYPRALQGADIPLESRILAVAEAFDSLTHDRPQRAALLAEAALQELESGAGSQFDPQVVSVLRRSLAEAGSDAAHAPDMRPRCLSLVRLSRDLCRGGQLEAAQEALRLADSMRSRLDDQTLEACWHAAAAQIAWQTGQRDQASAAAAQALQHLTAHPLAAESLLDLARLHLEMNDKPQAEQLAERAHAMCRDLHLPLGQARALLLRAAAAVGGNHFEERVLGLTSAIPDAAWPQLTQLEAGACSTLGEALRSDPALAKRCTALLLPAAARESSSAQVEIRALGRLSVLVNGVSIEEDWWQTRKAEIIFVLLAGAERPLLAERLAQDLWPAAEEGARQSLQTTVSRVRRAFRQAARTAGVVPDPIYFDRNFYSLHSALDISYDVSRFNAALGEARRLQAAGDSATAAQALERAVGLFVGSFMEGHTDDWVLARRTELESQYFDAMCLLASLQDPANAARTYQQVLERDPCREQAHLGLMRTYVATGKRDEAVRVYHACVKTLKKHLNLQPSPELVELYQTLS